MLLGYAFTELPLTPEENFICAGRKGIASADKLMRRRHR
jgi:hypothetical protein